MTEPVVTLAQARWQARLSDDDLDAEIQPVLDAAIDFVERHTGLLLTERDVTETFDRFGALRLKAWPIAADAAVTISYLDTAGSPQTQAAYRLSAQSRPARLLPAIGAAWPAVYCSPSAVSATFTAGYATPDHVPATLKQASLLLFSAYYRDREGGDVARAAEATARGLLDRGGFRHRSL